MSIVVEDGSIVDGANSYCTVDDLRIFATARAITVPVSDGDCEALLIKAMDFLETLSFIGTRVSPTTQPLQWPRENATVDGVDLDPSTVPLAVQNSEKWLAIVAQTIELQPTFSATSKGIVASESVYGAVSRTYFQKTGSSLSPYISSVNALLRLYLKASIPGMGALSAPVIRT